MEEEEEEIEEVSLTYACVVYNFNLIVSVLYQSSMRIQEFIMWLWSVLAVDTNYFDLQQMVFLQWIMILRRGSVLPSQSYCSS